MKRGNLTYVELIFVKVFPFLLFREKNQTCHERNVNIRYEKLTKHI